jgi:serine/threonine protein kinase
MSGLIADTYKVIGEIGAGGGGVVYLGEHLRLGKKVVLKADKRTLAEKVGKTAAEKPEAFRREVDALKNLSHTYIPQVYDFIEEDGVVYTVMDYIDGESLDKPLKRGQRFTQAQVIEWACQLLEALAYLHSRPPHGILHADIKPANIMLTSQGDVRLIDFNIALALGEEGAVGVGRSFGYASPEHYGLDFSSGSQTTQIVQESAETVMSGGDEAATVLESETELKSQSSSNNSSSSSTSSKKTIILNVRSDIYSLGATLYHMMTGVKPAQKADQVTPLTDIDKTCSPAVADIIAKSMQPDQDLRYGSAEEMLRAFEGLRENDPRTKRFRRAVKLSAAVIVCVFLLGVFTAFTGQRQAEQLQNALVLAEYSGNALRAGDVDAALDYALRALSERRGLFTAPNTAEAQLALTNALGVYDLSDGFKPHKTIELPGAPLYMRISPDGTTAAVVYAYPVVSVNTETNGDSTDPLRQYAFTVVVFDTETAAVTAVLQAEGSALAEAEFLDNGRIIFAGYDGITAYDTVNNSVLWTGAPATAIAVSADGSVVAAVNRNDSFARVYDALSGGIIGEIDFSGRQQRVPANDILANPGENLLTLNHDGSLLAVSFADGSLFMYDVNENSGSALFSGTPGMFFGGGFHGDLFAVSAWDGENASFQIIDMAERMEVAWFSASRPYGVQADANGISIQLRNILADICPYTMEQSALININEDVTGFALGDNHVLAAIEGEFMFFDMNMNLISRYSTESSSDLLQIAGGFALVGSRDTSVIRIMKYSSPSDTEIFSYEPGYAHFEARVNPEGTVMLYSFKGFRLYYLHGGLISEVTFPNAEHVHDPQFRRDGNPRLEVLYNDGRLLTYCAGTGELLSETSGEKPDLTLYEEFITDSYRIKSPLHGTPAAYDINNGRLIRELERDAYLTYVTQAGGYIITQYLSMDGGQGRFYGLLLNEKLETLAVLPYLSDINAEEGLLIFNYPTGNLRYTRIYELHELLELART